MSIKKIFMKQVLIVLSVFVVVVACRLIFKSKNMVDLDTKPRTEELQQVHKSPIRVIFYQDVSPSIKENGVELISPSVFAPYFNESGRSIELYFGVIESLTSKKLLYLSLPEAKFTKPRMPDVARLPFEMQNQAKKRHSVALANYSQDSIHFFSDRDARIKKFCYQVDSVLSPFRTNYSDKTDLTPALKIADKVFNYSPDSEIENFLLLNTDGYDSRKRNACAMKNSVDVILINANSNDNTNLDSVVTIQLQSSEQAIDFTLNKKH
jgi:hypothetical protein